MRVFKSFEEIKGIDVKFVYKRGDFIAIISKRELNQELRKQQKKVLK